MELSSPRFKAFAVTAGFSFWFFIISSTLDVFSLEIMGFFIAVTLIITQIFSIKLSKALDAFAVFNTKVFLGILFVFVVSFYGISFKILRIDLLRMKKQDDTYWLKIESHKSSKIFKQY